MWQAELFFYWCGDGGGGVWETIIDQNMVTLITLMSTIILPPIVCVLFRGKRVAVLEKQFTFMYTSPY